MARSVIANRRRSPGLYDEGLDPTFTVTHHFAAEEYEKAFATAAEGTAGKVILDWVPRD
ncbi:hypothetical protein [Streptomyces niveus]|uniref:Alcohol dehydrogenase n=1 Tax=Streptomyces niveus TaxID=193462 RepID=A0ABZ1ZYZ9_STRNV|nr:hypothetical protein [Streptomyces niveus]WTA63147.1 hypothetical protein OG211_33990 [Streptomyces niveus]